MSLFAQTLAALYGATVVNFSYRLAPEFKFPTAPNDVWDSLKWLAANADALGADTNTGFILGGSSAGANLAAVVSQRALDEKPSPPLTGVWLSIAWLVEEEIVPAEYKDLFFSREQNQDALILNQKAMDYLSAAYSPDIHSPDFSPFNAKNPHKGLCWSVTSES